MYDLDIIAESKIMKQPNLGIRLSEIRKERRLTQEELAEKCTVNVRTIQRIESGDVTPRSYTLNTIYGALEYDPQSHEGLSSFDKVLLFIQNLIYPSPNRMSSNNQKVSFVIGMISGIIYLCLGLLEVYVEYRIFEYGNVSIWDFSIVLTLSFVSAFLFYRALVLLGKKHNSALIIIGSYLIVATTLVITITSLVSFVNGDFLDMEPPIFSLLLFGPAQIVLGIGIFKLSSKYGRTSQFTGILEVLTGLCFLTIILFLLGFLIWIPALLGEVIILYRASTFSYVEFND